MSSAVKEESEAKILEVETDLKEHRQDFEALEERTQELSDTLDSILPEWIRGMVTPEEMILLHPTVLLCLLALLGLKAHLIRRSFLRVRGKIYPDGAYHRDPALSSLWTITCRGRFGTLRTVVVLIAGSTSLWWIFEIASTRSLEWSRGHPDGEWTSILPSPATTLLLGRAAFALAAVGIVWWVLRDRRREPAPGTAAPEKREGTAAGSPPTAPS